MTAVTDVPDGALTFAAYAMHIGKSRPYVSKLVAQGRIRPPALTPQRLILPDLADAMLAEGADPARSPLANAAGTEATYARERTLKTAADRERAELELAVRRGEMVPRSAIGAVILPAANRLRERVVQSVRDHVLDDVDRAKAEQALLDAFDVFATEIDPDGGAAAAR